MIKSQAAPETKTSGYTLLVGNRALQRHHQDLGKLPRRPSRHFCDRLLPASNTVGIIAVVAQEVKKGFQEMKDIRLIKIGFHLLDGPLQSDRLVWANNITGDRRF